MSVIAEWAHLDAAVLVGAEQAECALVRANGSARERRFTLKHVRGTQGTLTARRDGAGSADGAERIALACSMGPLGDGELEARVVFFVRRRLEDLRGRDCAPVRE